MSDKPNEIRCDFMMANEVRIPQGEENIVSKVETNNAHSHFMLVGITHLPLSIKWKHMVGTTHPTSTK